MNTQDLFGSGVSRDIWESRYRLQADHGADERTIADTWHRVSAALARVESTRQAHWQRVFYRALEDFRFLPGGRILAGCGTNRRVTLFNCFVMGRIEDSLDGIFDALKEGALTMQQGGGVGYDFSTLRPAGVRARDANRIASGPVSFLHIWDAMCATVLSTGSRRGAMMATLRCDHPDIEAFIDAKREAGSLTRFNLSILVSDAFMQAVRDDAAWPLVFPAEASCAGEGEYVERAWPGTKGTKRCRVHRRIGARALWERILRSAYDHAEPGVLFVDRINRLNNLYYREEITATNPCGEVPLPPYGACNLGSLNLVRFVSDPFGPSRRFDMQGFLHTVGIAVRMLDDVVDASAFPLPQQEAQAKGSRRIGLGITGLADSIAMLGHMYGDRASVVFAAGVMRGLCHAAYRASVALAGEKGAFPFFEPAYLDGAFIHSLPAALREAIRSRGIRNSHLVAIAPTGTISLLAGNVSSGLEPVFGLEHRRSVTDAHGSIRCYRLTDYAWRLWRDINGADAPTPAFFVTARELEADVHLRMQAALQPYVDNAISKTINVPAGIGFDRFRAVYETAFNDGLKGCTVFRPNPTTGEMLSAEHADAHCCTIDREAD